MILQVMMGKTWPTHAVKTEVRNGCSGIDSRAEALFALLTNLCCWREGIDFGFIGLRRATSSSLNFSVATIFHIFSSGPTTHRCIASHSSSAVAHSPSSSSRHHWMTFLTVGIVSLLNQRLSSAKISSAVTQSVLLVGSALALRSLGFHSSSRLIPNSTSSKMMPRARIFGWRCCLPVMPSVGSAGSKTVARCGLCAYICISSSQSSASRRKYKLSFVQGLSIHFDV